MSRKPIKAIRKRKELDIKYKNNVVNKFINSIMMDGKKATAANIVYKSIYMLCKLNNLDKASDSEMLEVFLKTIEIVRPQIEVKSRRVGGATYQIPTEVPYFRSLALAIRWLIGAARKRSEKSMTEKLAHELYDASKGRGGAVKNKENVQKMAEANRAFAHLRL